jgi:hypothetical protein
MAYQNQKNAKYFLTKQDTWLMETHVSRIHGANKNEEISPSNYRLSLYTQKLVSYFTQFS